MRILLINYPFPYFNSGEERFDFNYGIGRLAAYLASIYGNRVRVELKWRVLDPTDEFISECLGSEPDIIGLSCFLWNHAAVARTIESVKKSGFKGIVMLGGPAARFLYKQHNGFGGHPVYAIRGGGEKPFAKFIGLHHEGKINSKSQTPVPNLLEFKDNTVIEHPPWLMEESLDSLPSPFRAGILHPQEKDNVMFLEASRGCNRKCSYCFAHNATLDCKYSRFSPDYLVKELRWAASNNIPFIDFLEVSIGRDIKWVTELVDGILIRGHELEGIRFHFNLHPAELTSGLVKQMERLGARVQHIMVGVQSMSMQTAKTMRRRVNMKKLEEDLDRYASRLPLKVELIAGLPGDTPADLEQAVVNLARHDVKIIVNRLTVIPETEYFERMDEYGLVVDRNKLYQLVKSPEFSCEYLDNLGHRLHALFPDAPHRVEYNQTSVITPSD